MVSSLDDASDFLCIHSSVPSIVPVSAAATHGAPSADRLLLVAASSGSSPLLRRRVVGVVPHAAVVGLPHLGCTCCGKGRLVRNSRSCSIHIRGKSRPTDTSRIADLLTGSRREASLASIAAGPAVVPAAATASHRVPHVGRAGLLWVGVPAEVSAAATVAVAGLTPEAAAVVTAHRSAGAVPAAAPAHAAAPAAAAEAVSAHHPAAAHGAAAAAVPVAAAAAGGGELDADLVALEVVPVELAQDLVDLVALDLGVDVHEAEVLDDVGLDDGAIPLEHLAQLVICRSLSDVADEELLAGLPRSLRLALLNLDVSPLDVGAVQFGDGGRGRRLVVHMHESVVLDAFALGNGAETLEQRPQIGRLDDP